MNYNPVHATGPHKKGHAPVTRRKMTIRFVIMALVLALVFGGLYGFNKFRESMIADFFANNKPPPTPVTVATAKAEQVPRFLSGIGTLTAVRQVTVAPEVGGRVTQIFFEAGATVKAGDPLVQLNDKPEQADLQNYRAQAKLAEINLDRSRQLARRDYSPQAAVDQNQSQLDEANANILKTQAIIAQKLVRAPFDGVLGIRQIDLGQYVSPGSAIVTLTDLDTLYINFTVPEQARAQLAVGQETRITVDAYPGQEFRAQVTTIEPQINPETRTIRVQATMPNPGRRLLPGMFANVRVVLPPQGDLVTVPETSVDYTLYGDSVYVIRETEEQGKQVLRAVRTPVKTGERYEGKVAILDGVKPGDRVAVSGQIKLLSGAEVVIATDNALIPPPVIPAN